MPPHQRGAAMGLGGKIALGCGGLLVLLAVVCGFGMMGSCNALNSLGQAVDSQWGQVENVYQRRADLVRTVKGAAAFGKSTFLAVTEARAKVGQVSTAGKAPASSSSGLLGSRWVMRYFSRLVAAVSSRSRPATDLGAFKWTPFPGLLLLPFHVFQGRHIRTRSAGVRMAWR